ncbi:Actin cytoskeleton protein [Balamuthia mandrillaris]
MMDAQQTSTTSQKAVLVQNISPNATEKTVTDFFSFCGKITSLKLTVDEEGTKHALVVFESEAAAKTALLLSNALIVDRPITVVPAGAESGAELPEGTSTTTLHGSQIENKPHQLPPEQRTHTSVIASMIAAGYMVGAEAIQKAREYDEAHSISVQLKVGAQAIKAKASEIDQQYKISETASSWASYLASAASATTAAASAKWQELDQAVGISDTASSIRQTSGQLLQQVMESEPVVSTKEGFKTAGRELSQVAQQAKSETMRLFQEEGVLKTASEKVKEGNAMVSGAVKNISEDTARLIHEKKVAKGMAVSDEEGEEREESELRQQEQQAGEEQKEEKEGEEKEQQ